jgi:hypothetical protein
MTANPSIEPAIFLHNELAAAAPDLLRQLLKTFIETCMRAQASSDITARTTIPIVGFVSSYLSSVRDAWEHISRHTIIPRPETSKVLPPM